MKGPLVLTGASFAYRRDTPKITKPLPSGFTTITKPHLSRSWNDREHEMDEHSALRVVNAGSDDTASTATYDFFINVDNKYLKIIQKEAKGDASLLEEQFTYGFVLVGLALLQDAQRHETEMEKEGLGAEHYVTRTTRALTPVLIPMIQAIGQLSAESTDLQCRR